LRRTSDEIGATLTVHETLAAGSPLQMVPMIRNISRFLFSETTFTSAYASCLAESALGLAVARMLLRPSNTLLLERTDQPLDLDSKECCSMRSSTTAAR